MTISMYKVSVPVFIHMLNNLKGIIEKGAAHAEAKKIDPTVLLNYRLSPDMLPLTAQIQIATDLAKGCAARLAGIEPPKFEDNETTFAQLLERIQKAITFLNTVPAEQVDNSEEKTINLNLGGHAMSFAGLPYLLHFVLPNFYFHITTAYAILRHGGVELGKIDFMGNIS